MLVRASRVAAAVFTGDPAPPAPLTWGHRYSSGIEQHLFTSALEGADLLQLRAELAVTRGLHNSAASARRFRRVKVSPSLRWSR